MYLYVPEDTEKTQWRYQSSLCCRLGINQCFPNTSFAALPLERSHRVICFCWHSTRIIRTAWGYLPVQSHYTCRPGQALRVPGGWGTQISRQSAHEGGKVVSPTHRPHLLPRKYSWYSFLLETESTPRAIVRTEGLCQWKIPMTPSGITPATFRLGALTQIPTLRIFDSLMLEVNASLTEVTNVSYSAMSTLRVK